MIGLEPHDDRTPEAGPPPGSWTVRQVALGYIAAAWVIVQVLEVLSEPWNLSARMVRLIQIGLAVGFLSATISVFVRQRSWSRIRRPTFGNRDRVFSAAGWVLAGLLLASLAYTVASTRRDDRARTEALPRAEALLQQGAYLEAYAVASAALEQLPGDPALTELLDAVSLEVTVTSTPAGATVWVKEYADGPEAWRRLGTTPVSRTRLPVGTKQVRVELEGFEPELRVPWVLDSLSVVLDSVGWPEGMVRVPPSLSAPWTRDTGSGVVLQFQRFFYDRYEVRNSDYGRFVSQGGYADEDLWASLHPLGLADDTRSRFVDATGRQGPATWELGAPVPGTEDLPVSGISWFEAMAYCRSLGKTLPTIYHWSVASGVIMTSADVAAASNFASAGLRPGSESRGVGAFGTYDLAGNVREWIWNEAEGGQGSGGGRMILGGGWNDPAYSITHGNYLDPSDRSPGNGFRCILEPDAAATDPRIYAPITLIARDYYSETPVSDEIFEVFRRQFGYDQAPLEPLVEAEGTTEDGLRWELVSFEAAYTGSRVKAFVLRPAEGEGPFQSVVLFPGSAAPLEESVLGPGLSDQYEIHWLARTGRAVVIPVLKGTWSRQDGLPSTWPDETRSYADYVVRWVQDVSRTLDYMDTRADFESGSVAYFGYSWGGRMGPIILAVEDRFKVGILKSGGLAPARALPEVDQVNYVTRARQPVLLVNGERDSVVPVETAQRPMFDLLGAPDADKRHRIFPGGHLTPRVPTIREIADWLDRYLGPVEEV